MKKFLAGLVKDLIEQAWTLLGLGTAWVLLEGSARALVGNMILITLGFWVITYVIRREKDDE
jgi:putative Mn2+ efflux pump MntP